MYHRYARVPSYALSHFYRQYALVPVLAVRMTPHAFPNKLFVSVHETPFKKFDHISVITRKRTLISIIWMIGSDPFLTGYWLLDGIPLLNRYHFCAHYIFQRWIDTTLDGRGLFAVQVEHSLCCLILAISPKPMRWTAFKNLFNTRIPPNEFQRFGLEDRFI